jgi:hypothetical protein
MQQELKPIDFSKLEDWEMKPWKQFNLTEEQWRAPLHLLDAEHRDIIFKIMNQKYRLTLQAGDFNIPKK